MGLIRRYQFYKHILQLTLVLNFFFVCIGFVGIYRWLQTNEPTHSELIFVGGGVFIFGVIIPAIIFSQITKKLIELRKQTEQVVVQYVSQWINSFQEFEDEEPLHNPRFWLNMALLLFETLGENSKHPGLQALAEFSPMLRREIKVSTASKTSKKRSKTHDE